MRTFLMAVLLCLTAPSARADFRPYDGPHPLLVFIQSDPWNMVIGSDTPRIVVYENGEVVYVKASREGGRYYHALLSKADRDAITARIEPLAQPALNLKPNYDLTPGVTDQPQALFYIKSGNRVLTTRVYGLTMGTGGLDAFTRFSTERAAPPPPAALLKLHRFLSDFNPANGKPWTPKYAEVLLWDFSYARQSVPWPARWPTLRSERAIKRRDAYSVFLNGDQMPAIERFRRRMSEKTAVKLQGRKFALAVRSTFPGEPEWRRAFSQAR